MEHHKRSKYLYDYLSSIPSQSLKSCQHGKVLRKQVPVELQILPRLEVDSPHPALSAFQRQRGLIGCTLAIRTRLAYQCARGGAFSALAAIYPAHRRGASLDSPAPFLPAAPFLIFCSCRLRLIPLPPLYRAIIRPGRLSVAQKSCAASTSCKDIRASFMPTVAGIWYGHPIGKHESFPSGASKL